VDVSVAFFNTGTFFAIENIVLASLHFSKFFRILDPWPLSPAILPSRPPLFYRRRNRRNPHLKKTADARVRIR
jgi:hypothetical protein